MTTADTQWAYTPAAHKTEHHGRPRVVYLGPRAIRVIRPFLRADPAAYLFSPQDAMAARRVTRRRLRKSKVQPSQADRRTVDPKRPAGRRYDTAAYRRAIEYACARAGVPRWHPHQLRHNCATRLRRAFGLEAARVVLGHTSAAVTELYAEMDAGAAAAAMAEVG
jgi:integrase